MKDEGKVEDLRSRTKQYALRIIRLYSKLPKTKDAQIIGHQFLKSGTSVGANYREACRARSNAEFISKLGIIIQDSMKLHAGLNFCLMLKYTSALN